MSTINNKEIENIRKQMWAQLEAAIRNDVAAYPLLIDGVLRRMKQVFDCVYVSLPPLANIPKRARPWVMECSEWYCGQVAVAMQQAMFLAVEAEANKLGAESRLKA